MLCLLQRYSTWHTFLKKVRWLSLFRATCFRWFRCVATIVSFWRNQNFDYYPSHPKILDVTPFSNASFIFIPQDFIHIFVFRRSRAFSNRICSRLDSDLRFFFREKWCKDFGIRGNRGCVRRSETEEEVRARWSCP